MAALATAGASQLRRLEPNSLSMLACVRMQKLSVQVRVPSIHACHPRASAMLITSMSFHFRRMTTLEYT